MVVWCFQKRQISNSMINDHFPYNSIFTPHDEDAQYIIVNIYCMIWYDYFLYYFLHNLHTAVDNCSIKFYLLIFYTKHGKSNLPSIMRGFRILNMTIYIIPTSKIFKVLYTMSCIWVLSTSEFSLSDIFISFFFWFIHYKWSWSMHKDIISISGEFSQN